MYKPFYYSLKVWLTSVFIAPGLYILIMAIKQSVQTSYSFERSVDILSTYPSMILFQFLFSLITWILFFIIIISVVEVCPERKYQKAIISIAGVLLTLGTFWVVLFQDGLRLDDELSYLMIANCICIGSASFFYSLSGIVSN